MIKLVRYFCAGAQETRPPLGLDCGRKGRLFLYFTTIMALDGSIGTTLQSIWAWLFPSQPTYYQVLLGDYFFPYLFYWRIFGAISGVLLALSILRALWRGRRRRTAEKFALEHRQRQRQLIKDFIVANPAPDSDLMKQILAASVEELSSRARTGKWKVETIVLAYIHKAAAVHEQINCITEVLFVTALQRARHLDASSEKEGVLFGVPISIKDCMDIEDFPSSVGIIKWAEDRRLANAHIIECLLGAGAIPFCKTNVPQTMMSFECRNPLWGQTENPIRSGYSPGGSSGGEAALIGAGGSVLGLGSDIAGSLRIPAHFSGICTLKPSAYRLPHTGVRSFKPHPHLIYPVNGPMARRVDDLIPLMKACYGQSDIDIVPGVFPEVPTAWRKLRIGVMKRIDFIAPLPPCSRAVDEAISALEADGHEIVEFKMPFSDARLVELLYRAIAADGGHFYSKALEGEPIDPAIAPFMSLMRRSSIILWIYKFIASGYPDRRPFIFLNSMGIKDAIELSELLGARRNYQLQMTRSWREAGIDCLVMPSCATPAIPHGAFPFVSSAAAYTFIWNVLDYVAGIVPVTTVDPVRDVDVLDPAHFDTRNSTRLLEAEMENTYSAKHQAGLPVGVQVVTPQYAEVEALYAMRILETALVKYPPQQKSLLESDKQE